MKTSENNYIENNWLISDQLNQNRMKEIEHGQRSFNADLPDDSHDTISSTKSQGLVSIPFTKPARTLHQQPEEESVGASTCNMSRGKNSTKSGNTTALSSGRSHYTSQSNRNSKSGSIGTGSGHSSRSYEMSSTSSHSNGEQSSRSSNQSKSATLSRGTQTSSNFTGKESVPPNTTHGAFILSQDVSSKEEEPSDTAHVTRQRQTFQGSLYIVRSEQPSLTLSSSYDDVYEEQSSSSTCVVEKLPEMIEVESITSAVVSSATFDHENGVMEAFDVIIGEPGPTVDSMSSDEIVYQQRGPQDFPYIHDKDFYMLSQSIATNSVIANSKEEQVTANSPTQSIDLAYSNQDEYRHRAMSIPITPLSTIPYIHGSYAPAAPMMLEDKTWMKILRQLLPEAHADAVEVLKQAIGSKTSAKMAKIMKWSENNPVVAAYGILHSNGGNMNKGLAPDNNASPACTKADSVDSSRFATARREGGYQNRATFPPMTSRKTIVTPSRPRIRPTLEWDVFLDPAIVKAAEEALERVEQQDTDVGWTAAQMEVDRQISRLINRMILAHGTASQLVAEAIGFAPESNFSSIVEQSESLRLYRRKKQMKNWEGSGLHSWKNGLECGGKSIHPVPTATIDESELVSVPGKSTAKSSGIFVERWLRIFARALQLHRAGRVLIDAPCMEERDDEYLDMQQSTQPFCGMFVCLGYGDLNSKRTNHEMGTMAESAQEIWRLLGEQLHVVLDLKSRRVPPIIWARLIDVMRARGICVEGIGSFEADELRHISNACAVPVKKMRFYHSAGDLQKACHANEVEVGDTVFFNAGSLFANHTDSLSSSLMCCHGPLPNDFVRTAMFHPYAYPRAEIEATFGKVDCNATIEDYKRRFDLQIGLYVQEFSISQFAIESLVQFTNRHHKVYNLGLAWGGINGQTARGLDGDGYWSQRYMGRKWDKDAAPTGDLELLQPVDHQFVQRAVLAGAWGHLGTLNLAGESKAPQIVAGIGACHSADLT